MSNKTLIPGLVVVTSIAISLTFLTFYFLEQKFDTPTGGFTFVCCLCAMVMAIGQVISCALICEALDKEGKSQDAS